MPPIRTGSTAGGWIPEQTAEPALVPRFRIEARRSLLCRGKALGGGGSRAAGSRVAVGAVGVPRLHGASDTRGRPALVHTVPPVTKLGISRMGRGGMEPPRTICRITRERRRANA